MKKVLIAIAALIALVAIAVGVMAAIAPTDFQVEREIVINKPKAEVFEYLKFVKNQKEWGPWNKRDPNMKQTYKGTDGEVGFIAAWESNHEKVGAGEQEIKKIVEGERIENELRFKVPFESKSNGYYITESAGDDKTKVKWGFTAKAPIPMNIMFMFMDIDAEVGKDFEEGLADLKTVLEKQDSSTEDTKNEEKADQNPDASEEKESKEK